MWSSRKKIHEANRSKSSRADLAIGHESRVEVQTWTVSPTSSPRCPPKTPPSQLMQSQAQAHSQTDRSNHGIVMLSSSPTIIVSKAEGGHVGDPESQARFPQQHVQMSSLAPGHLGSPANFPSSPWTEPQNVHIEPHWHYSHRSPWLRALVLGANDGLVSITSLMLGVGAVKNDVKAMIVSGLAGLVAGAGSMAIGEFVSVFSQRDTELADLEKERQEHAKGPEAEKRELEELTQIYVGRGLPYLLAKQVAVELSKGDVLKVHARDELGIDVDALSNPLQAALASSLAFSLGGGVPLLAGSFIRSYHVRLGVVVAVSSIALAAFGAAGARLGGAPMTRAAFRVLIGGWMAMLLTYGVLTLLGISGL